jgi:predicted unusual protein kinase regulating ubiquinone biosynthesis (AarF/ABC1/UbiB family)
MYIYFIISISAFFGIFVLFLVISKTLNNIVNLLTKLEFLLSKELDYRKEALEIRRFFTENENQSMNDLKKIT